MVYGRRAGSGLGGESLGKMSKAQREKIMLEVHRAIGMMEKAKENAIKENVEWTAIEEGTLTLLRCFWVVFAHY